MNHKVMLWETNKRTLWQGRGLGYFVWKFPEGVNHLVGVLSCFSEGAPQRQPSKRFWRPLWA